MNDTTRNDVASGTTSTTSGTSGTSTTSIASTITTIALDQEVVTLVNVFSVIGGHQQRLVDLLVEATEQVMRHRPGFVSANIHASLDGSRVVNYAQWRSSEDFQQMLADPVARVHMDATKMFATAEPHFYEVVSIHHS